MDITSFPESGPYFRYEASGVVRCAGADAKKVQAGDRAVLRGIKTFSTVIISTELLVAALKLATPPRPDDGGGGSGEDEEELRPSSTGTSCSSASHPIRPSAAPTAAPADGRLPQRRRRGRGRRRRPTGAGKQADSLWAFMAKADPVLLKTPEADTFLPREIGKKVMIFLASMCSKGVSRLEAKVFALYGIEQFELEVVAECIFFCPPYYC
ncbi:hypothetical protein GGTG_12599 [Gaeumannomyces tritici R3-111a-1]|uniref:Uncharacterized protein n=1 Tax=Gaeumannomyces tritici (strain R3-111a-1) TaxID=644352 RepID=J3PGH4_GAET3|nr:hypothetical protein GGTG_12599 [Gaeumannomyces tritici R3-111a-1]EJT69716.1 hypothetical protein GGTG_12599 [Gaeumannomyces tritici R3-111a-1]